MSNRGYAFAIAMTLVMVTGTLTGCLDDETDEDFGVEWEEPNSIDVVNISTDRDNVEFDLRIKLWDSDGEVTEWSGDLRIVVLDENDEEVANISLNVKSKEFTTEKRGLFVDTWLDLSIKFSDFLHISELMKIDPVLYMDILLSFKFKDKELEKVKLWDEPAEVLVEEIQVDEANETIDVEVYLYDAEEFVTKWGGSLRIIMWDSLGFEMHNLSTTIEPKDFTVEMFFGDIWAWYDMSIPYSAISKSADRNVEQDPYWSGGEMKVFAWFTFRGQTVKQDPMGLYAELNKVTIPDALIEPNEAPEASFVMTGHGYVGEELLFDGSGTTDDMGAGLLDFEWSWGDGATDDTFDWPSASHTFDSAGTYNVLLTVRDSEGGEDSVGLQLEVLHNVSISIDEVGRVTDPGDKHNNSYMVMTISNAAPFPVLLPGLDPVLYDSGDNEAGHNGTDGIFLSRMEVDGSMTLTLYFEYAPAGVAVEFDPVRLVLLGWEIDWEIVLS